MSCCSYYHADFSNEIWALAAMEKILATAVIKMLTKGIGVATAEAQDQRAYTMEGESERCHTVPAAREKGEIGDSMGMDSDSPEDTV